MKKILNILVLITFIFNFSAADQGTKKIKKRPAKTATLDAGSAPSQKKKKVKQAEEESATETTTKENTDTQSLEPKTSEFAHSENYPKFSIALLGGYNVYNKPSMKVADPPDLLNSKASFQGGLGAVLGINSMFGVATDLIYTRRALSVRDEGQSSIISMTRLEIPVQAQLSLGMFNASAGFYYALGLGDLRENSGGQENSFSYKELAMKRSDLGLAAGMGVTLPVGKISLLAKLRYNFGLLNAYTSDAAADSNLGANASWKNRYFDVLIGLSF
jgi:hypothetical protein